ncbi:translation initiation factor IF-2 subunit beta [Candidatus Woesearchaeota archaeon]|nr:MAG: translation initiation factor IF-2 subunit beta [Candidatus Woesearchaeota archaeon]
MDYEKLLEKAREELPESVFQRERFEIPKVRGHIQGNKTVISNFQQIAETLGRPVEHLLKFITKELATPGEIKPKAVILGSKVAASKINEKIRQYANNYVLCPACSKPDTKMVKEGPITFIVCQACGAKNSIRAKI